MKLTMKIIDALECDPGQKDMLTFDSVQRGLAVRTTAAGGKSFLVQYSLGGTKRRMPLGGCNAISLTDARAAAQAIMGEVAKGRDPAGEKKAAAELLERERERQALTFAVLVDEWEKLQLANKSERYRTEAVRALRVNFKDFLGKPVTDISKEIVVNAVDKMTVERGANMAARTAAYGKACFQWSIKRGRIKENPFMLLPVAATEKRDRVLTDEELVKIWNASAPTTLFGAIVRVLVLTGQRREEVGGMTWDELSADLTTWTIPATRAKNGTAHIVPLSKPASDLLKSWERVEAAPWVFTGRQRRIGQTEDEPGELSLGAFNAWSKCKSRLDEASGVAGWRIHDLRRTMATGLQKLGVRLEVTEAVLNHVSGSRAGIVGVYQRHDFASEKRAALDAWGEHVLSLVAGQPQRSNIVTIKSRKAG